jgi:hypothetical protein
MSQAQEFEIRENAGEASFDDVESAEKLVKDSRLLKEFIQLRFTEQNVKQRLGEIKEEAVEEFRRLFPNTKSIAIKVGQLQEVKGRPEYKYSAAVEQLEAELIAKRQEERQTHVAEVVKVGEATLKITFNHNKNKETK